MSHVARSPDGIVVVTAPPLDPAGCIRGNVISDHEAEMLGRRARPP
jgi:hypothetical protein